MPAHHKELALPWHNEEHLLDYEVQIAVSAKSTTSSEYVRFCCLRPFIQMSRPYMSPLQ